MNKRKLILYTSASIVGIIILFFVVRMVNNRQYSSRLPEIPDASTISATVKEQIAEADKNARRNPTAENLGMLGMVYHSSANYSQAEQCYKLASERDKSAWVWDYYDGYLNIELGNSENAITNFNRVKEKNQQIKLAWYYTGGEYKNLGKNDLAEKSYMEIASVVNNNYATSSGVRRDHFPLATYAQFELARMYIDANQLNKADSLLNSMIQKYYLFGPSYRLLGNIYNTRGETELGEKYTVRANDLVAFTPPIDTLVDKLVLLSRSELYLLKRIDEAERSVYTDWTLELVNHGLQYLPDNKYLISKAIKTYLWKMQSQKAIALIDKHMALFEGNFTEMNKTGMLFFQKELYSQALKYWKKALEIQPDDAETEQNVAKCYWGSGDKEKAYQLLDEVFQKNSKNPEVLAKVTYLLYNLGATENATKKLAHVKRLASTNPNVLKMEAEIAEAKKDFSLAIAKYEASLKNDPENLQTIRKLGDLLFKQKQWKKYETLYKTSLKIYPNDPELLERLGTYLIDCPDTLYKNIPEGKEYVERAFTYYDCPPDILLSAGSHLSYAYAFLGEKQKAINTISQTINIAKGQNVSDSYMKMLQNFYRTFKNM